jgi:hypothetical protein
MDDPHDLSMSLSDADGVQVDVADQGMKVHVLPARLHPVDMPTSGLVRPHQKLTDLLVVSGVVVLPNRGSQVPAFLAKPAKLRRWLAGW